jgi:hypothetical protein
VGHLVLLGGQLVLLGGELLDHESELLNAAPHDEETELKPLQLRRTCGRQFCMGIKGRVWLFLRRQPVATCYDLALQKGNRSKGHMKRRQFLVNVGFATF